METSELRIGNWVNFIGNQGVEPLQIQQHHFGLKEFWFKVTPIPLTEKWLLKFGFEKSHVLNDDRIYFQIQDKFLAINSEGYCFYGCGDTKYIQLPIIIKTCHALQNFMYSFAGVELTIKEGVNK